MNENDYVSASQNTKMCCRTAIWTLRVQTSTTVQSEHDPLQVTTPLFTVFHQSYVTDNDIRVKDNSENVILEAVF